MDQCCHLQADEAPFALPLFSLELICDVTNCGKYFQTKAFFETEEENLDSMEKL